LGLLRDLVFRFGEADLVNGHLDVTDRILGERSEQYDRFAGHQGVRPSGLVAEVFKDEPCGLG
jgi:hypothetical protein